MKIMLKMLGVSTDNIRSLLVWICIVIVLLGVCISFDYADNSTVKCVKNQSKVGVANCTEVDNGVYLDNKIVNVKNSVVKVSNSDKIHKIKSSVPLITIVAKPSCGCNNGYYWHRRTFVNYCPHCHRYGALYNKHKWQSRYEQELTCRYDDCDYCGVCGKEKYSWSHYYLRRA